MNATEIRSEWMKLYGLSDAETAESMTLEPPVSESKEQRQLDAMLEIVEMNRLDRDLERMEDRACGCGLTAPCRQVIALTEVVDDLQKQVAEIKPQSLPSVLPDPQSPITQHFEQLWQSSRRW